MALVTSVRIFLGIDINQNGDGLFGFFESFTWLLVIIQGDCTLWTRESNSRSVKWVPDDKHVLLYIKTTVPLWWLLSLVLLTFDYFINTRSYLLSLLLVLLRRNRVGGGGPTRSACYKTQWQLGRLGKRLLTTFSRIWQPLWNHPNSLKRLPPKPKLRSSYTQYLYTSLHYW